MSEKPEDYDELVARKKVYDEVFEAVKNLTPEERSRVIRAVLAMFGEEVHIT